MEYPPPNKPPWDRNNWERMSKSQRRYSYEQWKLSLVRRGIDETEYYRLYQPDVYQRIHNVDPEPEAPDEPDVIPGTPPEDAVESSLTELHIDEVTHELDAVERETTTHLTADEFRRELETLENEEPTDLRTALKEFLHQLIEVVSRNYI